MKSYCKRVSERLERTLNRVNPNRVNEAKINERYPAEFRNLINLKAISSTLTKKGIDIQNSSFDTLEIKSGHDPKLKNAGFVIAVRDNRAGLAKVENGKRENLVNMEFFVDGDEDEHGYREEKHLEFKYLSWKKMLELGFKLYFIPGAASNADIKSTREKAKAGAIGLKRDEYKQHKYDKWSGGTEWRSKRGFDKSGYMLNPYKYRDMLKEIKATDGGWKQDAEAAINEYESYMDFIKESPRGVSTGRASKFLDRSLSGGIRNMMSYVGDLGESIEKIFEKAAKLDDAKANKSDSEWAVQVAQYELERAVQDLKDSRNLCKKKFAELEAEKNKND